MDEKVIAVVQARMGSSRLPNKMMLWLNGIPIIQWVIDRVTSSTQLDGVVFAIPDTQSNDLLNDYLSKQSLTVYRGSENNVLSRIYKSASQYNPTAVVRICADNPFISPTAIDDLIRFYKNSDYEYVYNHIPLGNKYPDGLGAEIVRYRVLADIYGKATTQEHLEHAMNYIYDNPKNYSMCTFDPPDPYIQRPELRFDVDTVEDYRKLLRLPLKPTSSDRELVDAMIKYACN